MCVCVCFWNRLPNNAYYGHKTFTGDSMGDSTRVRPASKVLLGQIRFSIPGKSASIIHMCLLSQIKEANSILALMDIAQKPWHPSLLSQINSQRKSAILLRDFWKAGQNC